MGLVETLQELGMKLHVGQDKDSPLADPHEEESF